MDISVDINSLFTLMGTKLKYEDYFKHQCRYLQPIQKRADKIKSKWERVAKLLGRPETVAYLHPRMRTLGQIYVHTKKGHSKLKRAIWQKLIRRSYKFRVLPSFRPFMCQRCNLQSFSLTLIKKHECRRRKYKAYSLDEIEKAANYGLRCGVRNAMCVLEMADYSNNVQLPPKIKCQTLTDLEQSLPLQKNKKVPREFFKTNENLIEAENSKIEISSLPTVNNSHLASFCFTCRQSFNHYKDFEQHSNCKLPDELKFLVKNSNKKIEFHETGEETLNSLISMLCSNCSRSDFIDSNDFHAHIVQCV